MRFGYGQSEPVDNFDEYVGFSRNYVFSRVDDRPFHACAEFWQLDDLVVTHQTMGALMADRSATSQSVAQADHITIVALFEGRIDYCGDDGAQPCEAGDLLVLDYRRRYHFTTPGHRALTVSLPRISVEDDVGTPLAGRMPSGGEASLLHDFSASLVRRLSTASATSAPMLAIILRRLLLLALRSCADAERDKAGAAVRATAIAYLDDHIGQQLDIGDMSSRLGLSRSSLYRMFKRDGGPVAFDRARRLRAVHQAICEGPVALAFGTVGSAHGFYDLNNLARQFRSHFGYTMSDLRNHVATARTVPPSNDSLQQFRQAIEGLSG